MMSWMTQRRKSRLLAPQSVEPYTRLSSVSSEQTFLADTQRRRRDIGPKWTVDCTSVAPGPQSPKGELSRSGGTFDLAVHHTKKARFGHCCSSGEEEVDSEESLSLMVMLGAVHHDR